MTDKHNDDHDKKIKLAISTTSGFYPEEGFIKVAVSQKIAVMINKASQVLSLTDTADWIATTSDNRQLNLQKSYKENSLEEEATIDWGRPEGGGGHG